MSEIAIQAEHLSKMYRLGVINNGTLWKDLQSWFALKRGKSDPHARIDADRFSGDADHFWALKDLNFSIKQGDRVGIIGKNGAGKSTLLKLLSRVTSPTEGVIRVRGKISSLLEVGTGFNGELTGRENIFLNGAILGMKTRSIDKKLDEIIAFSGIEHHIDTPVKRYSSGMYVRLAFAVAAHLDSEILIADEVLAVGDAEFQKRAIGKMQDLSADQGRTVLFVSHQLGAVRNLCNKGIILEKGRIVCDSDIDEAMNWYLSRRSSLPRVDWSDRPVKPEQKAKVMSVSMCNPVTGSETNSFEMGQDLLIEVEIEAYRPIQNLEVNFRVVSFDNINICAFRTKETYPGSTPNVNGRMKARVHVKNVNLFNGQYHIATSLAERNQVLDYLDNAISFEIIPAKVPVFSGRVVEKENALVYLPCEWEFAPLK